MCHKSRCNMHLINTGSTNQAILFRTQIINPTTNVHEIQIESGSKTFHIRKVC